MKATIVSYSLSQMPGDITTWKNQLMAEIENLLNSESELILYPELFLAGLGIYLPELKDIATYLEETLFPEIQKLMKAKGKLLVLGSGPRHSGKFLKNSSPIFMGDNLFFQDKLFLTPWETDFVPGDELILFSFKSLRTAVVICFDSEQPDLSMKLKEAGLDLMLIPSATTNKNGSQRVNRCASARAVELGAVVLTSPLIGACTYDLVDHNEGRQGIFYPAQDVVNVDQEFFSEYSIHDRIETTVSLDLSMLRKLKERTSETKPYHKESHPSLKLTMRNA